MSQSSVLFSLATLLKSALQPKKHFPDDTEKQLNTSVVGIGIVLVLGTALLVASAMVNFKEIQLARSQVVAHYEQTKTIPLISNPSPWRHLSFPIAWSVIFVVFAGLRHGAMAVFGDEKRNFLTGLAITIKAMAPLILIAILHGIGNNLFPFAKPLEEGDAIIYRSYLLIFLFFCGIGWEAYISVQANMLSFSQNSGRAILTWFTPWLAGIVFYAFIRFLAG
ncbi:MAG: hypothetical protein AAF518_09100 [Spirochaetota bacterium]